MKKILAIFLILFTPSTAIGCNFSDSDKIKHIQVSKKATIVSKKVFRVPFIPLKPVKWIFNPHIQKAFPDSYVPDILSAGMVFSAGLFKEFPIDFITPGRKCSYCDIMANYKGIKEGLKGN